MALITSRVSTMPVCGHEHVVVAELEGVGVAHALVVPVDPLRGGGAVAAEQADVAPRRRR